MKYECLVIDHDDTAVDSTAAIHFPAHLETMKILRPEHPPIDLDTWFRKNSYPGILAYLTEEIALNKHEMEEEYRIWNEFNQSRNPPFFHGLPQLLEQFQKKGGVLAVVSHSEEQNIRRHYRTGAPSVEPQFIFGWREDSQHRKPSPWPVLQILEQTGIAPQKTLVLDDLKPGVDMARAAGVPVAAAGWGHNVPEIQSQMSEICDFWLEDVNELRKLLFEESE